MALINVPDIQNLAAATPELWNSRYAPIVNAINGNLDDTNLAAGAVTTSRLAANAVSTAKIADEAVTPTKWINTYKFSAKGSSTGLGSSSTAIASYGTESFDSNSNFDPTTGLYTAPVAGFYQFNGCVVVGTSNGVVNVGRAFARKNGTDVRIVVGWTTPAVTGVAGGSFSFFLQLAATDTVGIAGLVSSGGTSMSESAFEGFLVSRT